MNFWLTRENAAAQTARLDDPLEITVVGRYRESSREVVEEIVRLRAGSILVEDDPHLYLSDGLIDTLIRRDYLWSSGRLDVLDRSLLPAYLNVGGSGSVDYSTTKMDLSLNGQGSLPIVSIQLPNAKRIMVDIGDDYAELPGLSLHRARIGVGTRMVELWGEVPLSLTIPSIVGGVIRPTFGLGARIKLDWSTLAVGVGLEEEPGALDEGDSVRLGFHGTLFGTLRPGKLVESYETTLDVGLSAREFLQYQRPINGVFSEESSLLFRPFLRLSINSIPIFSRSSALEFVALQTSFSSASISARFRFSSMFHLSSSLALHGIVGDPAPYQPEATLWITPGFRL